jgi:hypothetical protein
MPLCFASSSAVHRDGVFIAQRRKRPAHNPRGSAFDSARAYARRFARHAHLL